jgi:hypothetical protein
MSVVLGFGGAVAFMCVLPLIFIITKIAQCMFAITVCGAFVSGSVGERA